MSRSTPERVCRPLARPQTGRPLAALVLCIGLPLAACGADTPLALIASGKALTEKRDFRGAAVQFKAALQKDSGSPEIRQLLGHALLESGDPVNAAVELTKALEQASPPDPLRADHARALLQTGDLAFLYQLALSAVARGQIDTAERPALMDTLAMALAVNRQVPEALELQKRAVTLSPTKSGLRLNLAKIAVTAGDKELARNELTALEALGASSPPRDEVVKLLASL